MRVWVDADLCQRTWAKLMERGTGSRSDHMAAYHCGQHPTWNEITRRRGPNPLDIILGRGPFVTVLRYLLIDIKEAFLQSGD